MIAALIVLSVQAGSAEASSCDPIDTSYRIENQTVQLVDGLSEVQAAPGSAIKMTTRVVGKPVYGDLNGDGGKDAALVLVHEPGGSGTFHYVAAAIDKGDHWKGTNAVFKGER